MNVADVPDFRLRFPLANVADWAARYSYTDDAAVEAIGVAARQRGWYTRDEFLVVTRWKTQRSKSRCERNDEATVPAITRVALSTSDERLRIEVLTRLQGVQYPTASVLLHLAHRDRYPIIDYRALWSLGVETPPPYYSSEFWWAYTQACRSLAAEAGVSMRTLDRALWQYSKEHQDRGAVGRESRPTGMTLQGPDDSPPMIEKTRTPQARRYPYRADLHARLIETAANGATIAYSALGTSRRMVGSYLYRIAKEEEAAGRPPLTALVVHKGDGKPGPGFLEAAKWVGFWRPGETADEVWRRAVAEVHEYWRPKLADDLH
ncbi:MAG: hypothetical protein ACYDAK_12260 [Candidatus Limnocylindrales bacterium]